MNDTLSAALGDMLPDNSETVTVDVSEFFSRQFALTWKRPSVADVYMIGKGAAILLNENMEWHPQLAVDIASMAACHFAPSPGDMPVGRFYAHIATASNPSCWLYLTSRLREEFPYLVQAMTPEEVKKKLVASSDSASSTAEEGTLSN